MLFHCPTQVTSSCTAPTADGRKVYLRKQLWQLRVLKVSLRDVTENFSRMVCYVLSTDVSKQCSAFILGKAFQEVDSIFGLLDPEDKDITRLRNVGIYSTTGMEQHPRRL